MLIFAARSILVAQMQHIRGTAFNNDITDDGIPGQGGPGGFDGGWGGKLNTTPTGGAGLGPGGGGQGRGHHENSLNSPRYWLWRRRWRLPKFWCLWLWNM